VKECGEHARRAQQRVAHHESEIFSGQRARGGDVVLVAEPDDVDTVAGFYTPHQEVGAVRGRDERGTAFGCHAGEIMSESPHERRMQERLGFVDEDEVIVIASQRGVDTHERTYAVTELA
jgi:hypothetical protein